MEQRQSHGPALERGDLILSKRRGELESAVQLARIEKEVRESGQSEEKKSKTRRRGSFPHFGFLSLFRFIRLVSASFFSPLGYFVLVFLRAALVRARARRVITVGCKSEQAMPAGRVGFACLCVSHTKIRLSLLSSFFFSLSRGGRAGWQARQQQQQPASAGLREESLPAAPVLCSCTQGLFLSARPPAG